MVNDWLSGYPIIAKIIVSMVGLHISKFNNRSSIVAMKLVNFARVH